MKKGSVNPSRYRAAVRNCLKCQKEFRAVKDFKERKQKYCSKDCWSNRVGKKDIECLNKCGITFKAYLKSSNKKVYCSPKCKSDHYKIRFRGENALAWKDGSSIKNERKRLGNDMVIWRKAVFERDGYMCRLCLSGKPIQAHHIKFLSTHPELATDVLNGITLCIKCHGDIHGRDFSNRRKKECESCGAKIVNKDLTGLCRSCGIQKWWDSRKAADFTYQSDNIYLERDGEKIPYRSFNLT